MKIEDSHKQRKAVSSLMTSHSVYAECFPEAPSTQYLRFLVRSTITIDGFGDQKPSNIGYLDTLVRQGWVLSPDTRGLGRIMCLDTKLEEALTCVDTSTWYCLPEHVQQAESKDGTGHEPKSSVFAGKPTTSWGVAALTQRVKEKPSRKPDNNMCQQSASNPQPPFKTPPNTM